MEPGMFERLFAQMVELWLQPEIERRRDTNAGQVPSTISRAQVIFFADGRRNEVRFNEELDIEVAVEYVDGYVPTESEAFNPRKVRAVRAISLRGEQYANGGHMTLLPNAEGWQISFDLVYNRANAQKHLAAADEFLAAAQDALARDHMRLFADALFSACELGAKAALLADAGPEFLAGTNHRAIKARFNLQAKVGNVASGHASVLNRLTQLRGSARYLDAEYTLCRTEAEAMLAVVQAVVSDAREYYERRAV